jgi:RNA processing factor Prp31
MVVQAVSLLDDLDKEINIYAMRIKEWYGWHFPEMAKIIVDNLAYAKVVRAMGKGYRLSQNGVFTYLYFRVANASCRYLSCKYPP